MIYNSKTDKPPKTHVNWVQIWEYSQILIARSKKIPINLNHASQHSQNCLLVQVFGLELLCITLPWFNFSLNVQNKEKLKISNKRTKFTYQPFAWNEVIDYFFRFQCGKLFKIFSLHYKFFMQINRWAIQGTWSLKYICLCVNKDMLANSDLKLKLCCFKQIKKS